MLPAPDYVSRAPWKYDIAPFEIADRLYYVGNTSVSAHLFDTGQGLLLLDTTYAETGYLLFESIRELGFEPKDIRWIVHSHAHIDHFGATRYLVEKYGCKTYMPAADLDFLTTKAPLNWCEELDMPYEPPYGTYFDVDVPIHPGDVLQFGNIKMTAHCAAGHTPGTMAYVFELPCGLKAAMHGGIGMNTLTSEYTKKHNLGTVWREAFIDSLNRLYGLEVDVVLGNHPGQNDTFGKLKRRTADSNPFIDPSEWDRMIDMLRNKFHERMLSDPL